MNWWCQAAVSLTLLACSEDGGEAVRNAGGGSSDDEPTLPEAPPARARRGEVTLLATSASLPTSSWTLIGPASGADDGEATVICAVTTTLEGATLEVTGAAGSGVPSTALVVQLSEVGPVARDVSYDELAKAQPLSFDASLPGNVRYVYGYDPGTTPIVRSSCHVTVTALNERSAAGQIACRNLLAAADSADAPAPGSPAARASVTIAFDCPVVTHAGPQPDPSGGSGGVAGTGGADPGKGGTSGDGGKGGGGGQGGASEPLKSCRGVASTCSSRTSATCSSVKGCSTDGECGGVSSSCYAQYSSYACNSQQGCYWSTLNKSCSGSAWSCSSMSGSASCVSQSGCNWRLSCEGSATPCALLSEVECSSQPGCSWE